jgi:hypothetical protein
VIDPNACIDPELPDSYSSIYGVAIITAGLPPSDMEDLYFAEEVCRKTGYAYTFENMPSRDTKEENAIEKEKMRDTSNFYFNRYNSFQKLREQKVKEEKAQNSNFGSFPT